MFTSDTIPREMVQYAGKIPDESVVDVFATVRSVGSVAVCHWLTAFLCGGIISVVPKPTNTTQSEVELQVERIYAVSVAIRATPFQLSDAMNPEDQHLTVHVTGMLLCVCVVWCS